MPKRPQPETITTFQVEKRLPPNGWEQVFPVVRNLRDGVILLRAEAIKALITGSREEHRLVETIKRAVAA